MFYIRRLWLIPACFFIIIFYYVFHHVRREETYHYGQHQTGFHLNPKTHQTQYPVTSYTPLPTKPAKEIPKIQFDFSSVSESSEDKKVRLERRAAIKENFLHAWNGYKKHAWAKDEVSPISGDWRNSFGGWGATLVDTMDTLWLMGLHNEFEECVKEVKKIDFTTNTEGQLNVFETTIRYLGGLLAAYDLSKGKYPVLLEKAKELGEILYLPFDTPNHMPLARWPWALTAQGQPIGTAHVQTLIAELGSLTLEFTRLSQLTGNPKWFDAVQRIGTAMARNQDKTRMPGLWPTIVDAEGLQFNYNHFTLGGMVDSAYEYLPKQYLLLGGLDDMYKNMYLKALETAKKHLFFRPLTPLNSNILFSGNAYNITSGVTLDAQAQHLTCFLGGMVGVASRIFSRPEDLSIARKLVDGCIWAYGATPSGLMPELFNIVPCHAGLTPKAGDECKWSDDRYYEAVAAQQPKSELVAGLAEIEAGKWWVKQKQLFAPFTDMSDNRYILRPEAIESIFILYRITGDRSLLDAAWQMFESIEHATRTQIAHAGISDVRLDNPPQMDRMESFWLAETLKYFYLIFDEPDVMDLDQWVLNTEAHPLKRPMPGKKLVG